MSGMHLSPEDRDELARLRADLEALADEWRQAAEDPNWAAPFRLTWRSCEGQLRSVLLGRDL